MKLIKLIEVPLKHWDKRNVGKAEMHIKEPNEFELEKAIANCRVNDLDTLIIYK